MKKVCILISVLCGLSLSAQSLTPQVMASAGNSFSSASARIEFTIGETVTSTFTAGSNTLTQGFHQPEIHFASIGTNNDQFNFLLYPNPTTDLVTIESTQDADKLIQVYDGVGQVIFTSSIFQKKITVDLQWMAAGIYILRVTTQSGEPLHNYTVIKKSTY